MASAAQARRERVIEGMAIWGSYYRENFDIFVEEYLQLDFLKWFQTMLLVMMNRSRVFLWIAARGMGKSFLIAIFAVARCILYPGTKVVITSGTRGQSINVLEKIQTELMPVSPNLRNEIDMNKTKFSGQDAKVMFKNGSFIKVVTASDNARSNRANILIVDEFRMVKKDTIDTVLKKFLTSRRMPPYRELTEAQRKEFLKFRSEMCETKAINRALRAAMHIKGTYFLEELKKPFVVAYLVPNLDNETVKAEAVRHMFTTAQELYGGHTTEARRAIFVEDDVEEGMEYETPERPISQPGSRAYQEAPQEPPRETQRRQQPPQGRQQGRGQEEYDPTICAACGADISPSVSGYSIRNYGMPLCRECQRKEQRR